MKEIKPCPFCGGKGELDGDIEVESTWGTVWVKCTECGAEGSWIDKNYGDLIDDTIDKWNQRV